MPSANFRHFGLALARGQVNFETGAFKCLLVTSAPTESQLDTWEDRADVTIEHAAGSGYTAGGFNVTRGTMVLNTTLDRLEIPFTAASPTLTGVTLSGVVGALLYLSTGTAANDILLCWIDYGGPRSVTTGSFTHSFTTPLLIRMAGT